jgi:hypothetical protein
MEPPSFLLCILRIKNWKIRTERFYGNLHANLDNIINSFSIILKDPMIYLILSQFESLTTLLLGHFNGSFLIGQPLISATGYTFQSCMPRTIFQI